MPSYLPKPHKVISDELDISLRIQRLELAALIFLSYLSPLPISHPPSNAAGLLVDAAKREAEADADKRNDAETAALKEAWGQQGTRVVQGGAKAVKELEKDQKSRQTRMVRDYLDRALLDIATFYRDVLLVQSGADAEGSLINGDMEREIKIVASNTRCRIHIKKA